LLRVDVDGLAEVVDPEIAIIVRISLSKPLPSGACVVPILSLPLCIHTNGIISSDGPIYDFVHFADGLFPSCIRMIDTAGRILPNACDESSLSGECSVNNNHPVLAFECPGLLGIGGKVWDSTYILLEYLGLNRQLIRGRKVIELGSGTGIAGKNRRFRFLNFLSWHD
jgi:hypothetical protein